VIMSTARVREVWATQGSLVHRTVFAALAGPEKENEKKLRSVTVAIDRLRGTKCPR
jgi:hypothetical protein